MAERRERLAQGREAEIFLLDDDTVLKLLWDPASEPRVHREAAALRALREHGQPVPEALEVVEVDGRPGLVMERRDGHDLLALLGRQPQKVLTTGRLMGELHAAMHGCDAPPELPDLNTELWERIEAAPLSDHLRDATLDLLDGLPDGDGLCHGDFHIGNVISSRNGPTIIDWGDAARGDPTADVARTLLLHRIGEPPPDAPASVRFSAQAGRGLLTSRYLAAYRRARAIDQDLLTRWEVIRAAARLSEPIPEERSRVLRIVEQHFATP